MTRYSVTDAKNGLPTLLDRALAGEEVIITRRGNPVAWIVRDQLQGAPLDLNWIDAHRVTPAAGSDFEAATLIRQMRDE